MQLADRAFFFDNTITSNMENEYAFFAEKTDDKLRIKNGMDIPWWFYKYLLP